MNRRTTSTQPISDSDPTLQTSSIYYEGLKTRFVDANGKERARVQTVVGGVARSTDHNGYGQLFDYDAFMNAVRVMDTAGVTLQTGTFDVRGNQTASTDADRGASSYVFNALGEMTSTTDSLARTTTYQFDKLSRMTQRIEPIYADTITATWTWGTAADNTAGNKYIGRLKQQALVLELSHFGTSLDHFYQISFYFQIRSSSNIIL